jgi:hypothetical protein
MKGEVKMNPHRSYSRRTRKKGKWIIILIVLTFAVFKIYNRNSGPVVTVADEGELGISAVEPDIEDSVMLPTTGYPVSEPTVHQITGLRQESNPGSTIPVDDIPAGIDTNGPGVIQTRDRLNRMLSTAMSAQQLSLVKKQLSALSEKWLFRQRGLSR